MREGITRILTQIHGWVFLLITSYRQHYTDFDTATRMGVFCFYRLPTARYGYTDRCFYRLLITNNK